MITVRKFYGIIDLTARARVPAYATSTITNVYKHNQVVELVEYKDDRAGNVKWHNLGNEKFYTIPKGCFKEALKEDYPEYYL